MKFLTVKCAVLSTFVIQYLPTRGLPTLEMDLNSLKTFHYDSSPVVSVQIHNIYVTIMSNFTLGFMFSSTDLLHIIII